MRNTVKRITLLTFLGFTAFLFAQPGDGWEKSFGVVQHSGSPYPFMVTQEVHAGHDFDQDGNMEFFVVTDHSNPNSGGQWEQPTGASVWLYEADASGNYQLEWSWFDTTLFTGGASFPPATVADLDGDGGQELLLGIPYGTGNPPDGSNPIRLYVWEGGLAGLPADGTPTATWDFGVSVGTNTRPSAMAAADIDGDGAQEVAVAFRKFSDALGNDAMMIFSLSGAFAGTFTQWTVEMIDSTSDVGSVYAASITDLDGDSKLEAFFSTDYGSWFEGAGANTYDAYPEHLQPGITFWTIHGSSSADIDGDGFREMFIGKTNGDLYLIDGVSDLATADSTNLVRIMNLSPSGCRGLAAGDFDGDGNIDIFMGGNYGSDVWHAEYNGTGSFTDSANYTVELVYTHDTTGAVRAYTLSFGGDQETPSGSADLNGNGFPDLVIGFEDGDSSATEYVVVLEHTGVIAIESNFGAPILNAYRLSQNYPNPFNPTTTIDYSLTKGGHVDLAIYDLLGRKVKTLIAEHHAPGEYSVRWDGTDAQGATVASGVYLYKLRINGAVLSQQMTYLR